MNEAKERRLVWVDVGHRWRDAFTKWFKQNKMPIWDQGWTRGSTGWGFQVETDLTPDDLQDKLWNEVPGAGMIAISTGYVDDDEEDDEQDVSGDYPSIFDAEGRYQTRQMGQ